MTVTSSLLSDEELNPFNMANILNKNDRYSTKIDSLIFDNLEKYIESKGIKMNCRAKLDRLETNWAVIHVKIVGPVQK